ncbi:Os07g0231300 [Oryza sativa Japonica Group]|uniref:Os07g0231300 protein n=1 Tax=Oryza sativa subsp. japonica TaxID=39947 RepID=A0A0P0X422_ORYSJ|nr:Os07g0231300 [Oryza sativa Japonica Group]
MCFAIRALAASSPTPTNSSFSSSTPATTQTLAKADELGFWGGEGRGKKGEFAELRGMVVGGGGLVVGGGTGGRRGIGGAGAAGMEEGGGPVLVAGA